MRILFFVLLLNVNFIYTFSQAKFEIRVTERKDSILQELQVKDTMFYPILDSIIAYEPNCKYYSKKLYYWITVCREYLSAKDSVDVIQIESNNKIGMITTPNNIGYFYYKDNLFVVSGFLYKLLFSPTGKQKAFPFEPYDIYIDDSFSIWMYRYIDKKIVLEGYCRCNDEKAIYLIPPTKGGRIVY